MIDRGEDRPTNQDRSRTRKSSGHAGFPRSLATPATGKCASDFLANPKPIAHRTMLGAALMVGLSAIVALGDQPGIHSVLRQPVIQLARPMTFQGIETGNSKRFEPVVLQAELRLAQTSDRLVLTQSEELPSPLPVRDGRDPEIPPMRDIRIDITPPVELDSSGSPLPSPEDFASEVFRSQPAFPRDPPPNGPWFGDAAYGPPLNFCYRPLYFEEPNLERYGRTAGILQPLVSAGNFYGGVAVLPYRLAAQRSGFCTYHEHCYRPGAPAPRERQLPHVRLDAATVQAAAVIGLVFLIP